MSLTTENSEPSVDEVLSLDRLCLQEPDGKALDEVAHRQRLEMSLSRSKWGLVRCSGDLLGYGHLWPAGSDEWFVGGLAIHPAHRKPPTVVALGRTIGDLLSIVGAKRLKSHVLRNNAASLRLHKRLGFAVEQENDTAIAFSADCATILARLRF